jgi:magnesium transporter
MVNLYEYLNRVYESIEAGSNLVGSCMDSYPSKVSLRTNDIMQSLTVLSAFILPMTFLTDFFGMNFEVLPFRSHSLFWQCLFAMFVGIPVGMLLLFQHRA